MKVLKFSTPTCTYCKITSPKINDWAEVVGYDIEEVDASVEVDTADKYEVMGVPAIVITNELGEAQQKLTGFQEIMQFINK